MPLYSFEGKAPRVHPTAFIAPTATLVGDVTIEANASVWYGAVLRGDLGSVIVRAGANIQDGAVLHGALEVGEGATVAHNCVVHAASLGDECLIANGAIVLDGARIGARSLVAAGALVAPGAEIPEEVLVVGIPARVKQPLAGTRAEQWVRTNPTFYQELARRHKTSLAPVEP
jgi:carbonic anhydrase/acetyltransferase-like protein (isoleucine patch superfamily)